MSCLFNFCGDDRKPRDCGIIYCVTDKQSAHTTTIFQKREPSGQFVVYGNCWYCLCWPALNDYSSHN